MFKFNKKKSNETNEVAQSSHSSLQSANASNQRLAPEGQLTAAPLLGTLFVRVVQVKGITAIQPDSSPYLRIEVDKNEEFVPSSTNDAESVHFKKKVTFDISRLAPIEISVIAPTQDGGVLLGTLLLPPDYSDEKPQDKWWPVSPAVSLPGAVFMRVNVVFEDGRAKKPMSIDDFELLKVIGKGSFGKVMQVKKRDSNRIYAMKILKKAHIVERDEVAHTLAEKKVLSKINNPFIVNLKYAFQSPEKLYLALAFVNGGELFHHLQIEGRFSEPRAKFYTAELLCAIECLHTHDIVYRDLKPENILLDSAGHIALCDFGLCKLYMNDGIKTNTFCGTPEYLAPEVLIGKGYNKVVDWWTLGILLFEMITGLPPFYDENVNAMYKKILQEPLQFPAGVSPAAEDILRKLLNRDPATRLGANGTKAIKDHPFFADVDFKRLLQKRYTPPFRPNVQSALDTSNFDTEFTSEVPVDSVADTSHLPADVQERFKGFTYKNHEAIAGSLAGSVANRMGTLTNRMDTLVVSHLPGGGLSSVNELNDERS